MSNIKFSIPYDWDSPPEHNGSQQPAQSVSGANSDKSAKAKKPKKPKKQSKQRLRNSR